MASQQYVYPPTQEQSYDVYPLPNSKIQALFAPGTDPEIIRAFRGYDEDGNGFIDDDDRVAENSFPFYSTWK
ncbi:hypothetical protein SUGI_1005340 [Cryptomeria japonica]|nr:hypothetical protein SUGI_1005340 [Cryptomeria japonica]